MFKHYLFSIVLFIAFRGSLQETQNEFRLANMFTDGVVLQRWEGDMDDPTTWRGASIWGYGPPGTKVVADVLLDGVPSEVLVVDVGDDGIWGGAFAPHLSFVGFGYQLQVDNMDDSGTVLGSITIDVAFGEVWLCSGQSNMQWKINGVRNAPYEIQNAALYENIRLTQVVNKISTEPLLEPIGYSTLWSKPEVNYLTNGASFSAICLMFGERLSDNFQEVGIDMPIGLVDSSWGGTIIEAWTPPEALQSCGVTDNGIGDENNHNEYLWNAMIHSLTRMSIRGAIWYQGEQNAGYPGNYPGHNREIYDCTFKAMIDSWRQRWNNGTKGATADFPFGFVQLAPFTDQREHLAWPELRWRQTANKGLVPNELLENVFMAAAMDDDIDLHPKNKRIPSLRLGWAAINLAYGNFNNTLDRPLFGPQPTRVSFDGATLNVEFSAELQPIYVEEDRFMVCCLATMEECDQVAYGEGWSGVLISGMLTNNIVTLDATNACGGEANFSGLAYLWLETPCRGELGCPLYAADEYMLPVAPFRMEIS